MTHGLQMSPWQEGGRTQVPGLSPKLSRPEQPLPVTDSVYARRLRNYPSRALLSPVAVGSSPEASVVCPSLLHSQNSASRQAGDKAYLL